jgi:hypothetical protein
MTVKDKCLPVAGLGAEFAWCRSGWSGHVGETAGEFDDGGLAVFDDSAFIVGERDAYQHALKVALGLDELAGAGPLGSVEVAAAHFESSDRWPGPLPPVDHG